MAGAVFAMGGLAVAFTQQVLWALAGLASFATVIPLLLAYPQFGPRSIQRVDAEDLRLTQFALCLLAVVAALASSVSMWHNASWGDRDQYLWAGILLTVLLLVGFALTWYESKDTSARPGWLEPTALVLAIAVGAALSSVVELQLVGGFDPADWSLAAAGLVAAFLLARMRVSHWLLGARLGPIIPIRTGPDSFVGRWRITDSVVRAYAAQMLPRNPVLSSIEYTYKKDEVPTIQECADALEAKVKEKLSAALVLMPSSRGVIFSPEGKLEELIVAAAGIAQIAKDDCCVLFDDRGEDGGAFRVVPLQPHVETRDDTEATPPEYKFACLVRAEAPKGWTTIKVAWLPGDKDGIQKVVAGAVAAIREKTPPPCQARITTDSSHSFAFAMGYNLQGQGITVGSARLQDKEDDKVAEYITNDNGDFLSANGKDEGTRYQPSPWEVRWWYIKLLVGSLLATFAVLALGAVIALAMEWRLLASEASPPWLGLLWWFVGAFATGAVGLALLGGVTSPSFVLDLTGTGRNSVGWWRTRTMTYPAKDKSADAVARAEWVKQRLGDIYSAFPDTTAVTIRVPKSDDEERVDWKKFASELKLAFRGPRPLKVTDGERETVIVPRTHADVQSEKKNLPGSTVLAAIVEGTRPK